MKKILFTSIIILSYLAAANTMAENPVNLISPQEIESEVVMNLKGIKTAELAYESNFDVFVSASAYPPKPSTTPQKWVKTSSGGFITIGWAPDGNVRGSYSVTTSTVDFTAKGVVDIDGDGILETYTATRSINPSSTIPPAKTFSPSTSKNIEGEVVMNLKGIKTAELAYESNFDVFVSASAYPPKPSTTPQKWVKTSSGGFITIGWAPDGNVRGSYSVTTSTVDFTAKGVVDIDGDGILETYTATKSTNPTRK